jgi:hypothetical protein
MKLTESLKTYIDEDAALRFQRRACAAGCTAAELLRDMVFHLEYGVTFGEHVAQSRRHALSREGSTAALTRAEDVPPAVQLSVINARKDCL